MKNNKKGISLAEVMIVVTIIAIVAIVFLAMPKKKVSKMDKAKYYAAYTMLKTFQDARLAKYGSANLTIDTNTTAANKNFNNDVYTWLNVQTTPQETTMNGNTYYYVDLINGMRMYWSKGNSTPYTIDNVIIDLDGEGNGLGVDGKDKHDFKLYSTPPTDNNNNYGQLLVIPDVDQAGSNSDWIEFRVYRLYVDDPDTKKWDGRKNYTSGTARATYVDANNQYNTCNTNYPDECFIEAKKPY